MNSRGGRGEHSAGLEAVIQKLEESLLNPDSSAEEKTLTVRGNDVDSTATPVPALIRKIITQNLAEGPAVSGAAVTAGDEQSVQEENQRLKDLLSHTCLDRDQLHNKQTALSSRVDRCVWRRDQGDHSQRFFDGEREKEGA
ncbi:hypothetical protein AOLI_G00006560 [Acnodon oligacanthus]